MKAIIYKITYPNGKIYIGQDRTNSITYFGSPSDALVATDFTDADRKVFTVTREVLWSSETASHAEVTRMEIHYIKTHRANIPAIGYKQWPKKIDPD